MRNQWAWAVVGAAVVLAIGMPAQAAITGITAADDGDGNLVCKFGGWKDVVVDQAPEYEMGITGNQYAGPGHILGTITTNTELDPTLRIINAIDNDTAFAWTGYQVNFSMSKPFTLSSVSVLGPTGWTANYPTGSITTGTAAIVFTMPAGGTPIGVNDTITFSFKASFLGGASYAMEMTPTPEPATMSLLALGGLAMLRKRRVR